MMLHSCTIETEVLADRLLGLEDHYFCFAKIDCELTLSQAVASASRCRWSPSGLVEIRIRSWAYSNNGAEMLLLCTNASSLEDMLFQTINI